MWTIEPLTSPDEIDAIVAIEHASFTSPWTREMYVAELEKRGMAYFFLAKTPEREIVGFCSFWHVVDELHINNLAVAPSHRRAVRPSPRVPTRACLVRGGRPGLAREVLV